MREKTSLLALLRRMHKNWVGSRKHFWERDTQPIAALCELSAKAQTLHNTHKHSLAVFTIKSFSSLFQELNLSMTMIQNPHNHHHHQVLLLLLLQLLRHLHHQQHRFAAVKCGAQISRLLCKKKFASFWKDEDQSDPDMMAIASRNRTRNLGFGGRRDQIERRG